MENKEILERLCSNEKISERNPFILSELSMSCEELDEEVMFQYEKLLEVVDFDRVAVCANFAIMNPNEASDVDRGVYFSRWKNETFWKNLQLGSAVSSKEIVRREIKDVISRQLKSVLKLCGVRLVHLRSSNLYYSENDQLKLLENFNEQSFISFCMYIFARYLKLSEDDAIKTALRDRVKPASNNSIIQFLDCYIKEGKYFVGVSEDSPQWIIQRFLRPAIESGKPTVHSRAVDMLIDHLTDFDIMTKHRLRDILSTMYMNSASLKSKFGGTLRIFGSSGANGKSKFIDLLIRSVGYDCVASVSVQDLDDDRSVYSAALAMLTVDDDAPSTRITGLASSNFKKFTTGGVVKTRALYKEAITVTPKCTMVIASNHLPRAEDKSEGFLRRWNLIEIKTRLHDRYDLDEDWFKELDSDVSAQYMCEMLVLRFLELSNGAEMSPKSESMLELDRRYAEDNNSAAAFVNDLGIEKIIGFSVREVREHYESYCKENDLPVMQRQFNETLENQFSLIVKPAGVMRVSESSDQFALLRQKLKRTIKVWQHTDDEVNIIYLPNLKQM